MNLWFTLNDENTLRFQPQRGGSIHSPVCSDRRKAGAEGWVKSNQSVQAPEGRVYFIVIRFEPPLWGLQGLLASLTQRFASLHTGL